MPRFARLGLATMASVSRVEWRGCDRGGEGASCPTHSTRISTNRCYLLTNTNHGALYLPRLHLWCTEPLPLDSAPNPPGIFAPPQGQEDLVHHGARQSTQPINHMCTTISTSNTSPTTGPSTGTWPWPPPCPSSTSATPRLQGRGSPAIPTTLPLEVPTLPFNQSTIQPCNPPTNHPNVQP